MRRLIFLLPVLVACSGCADRTDESVVTFANDQEAAEFSAREIGAIRRHISEHWLLDPSIQRLEQLEAKVVAEMNPNGSMQSARTVTGEHADDPNWRRFAESCRRAVLKASPLTIPPDKPYAAWKTITFTFKMRDMSAP